MTDSQDSYELDCRKHNRQAWDRMVQADHVLTKPASDEELKDPLSIVDGIGWLGSSIRGWNVLCLAAGGGRHGPLYAAAGGLITVVDISPMALQRDREAATAKDLSIRTIETSMDDLSMLATGQFDLVIHPVSSCYLPKTEPMFKEIARVTKPNGLYISQHKQPINLQASLETHLGQYVVEHAYYDSRPVPAARQPSRLREPGTREFIHSWQSLIGGMCRHGFVIEDLIEPLHADPKSPVGSFGHRCHFIAPYVRIKARRTSTTHLPALVLP